MSCRVLRVVVSLVRSGLGEAGISIVTEGVLGYKAIDDQRLIDTHYGAIAMKAMVLKPHELSPTDKAKVQARG